MGNEQQYIDLLFRSSHGYANWEPEKPMEVGDWGKITFGRPLWAFWRPKRFAFVKQGNIYRDKIAENNGIPQPTVRTEEVPNGMTWVTSQNTQDMDVSASMQNQTSALAKCSVKAGFQFSAGGGAVLLMVNDSVSTIEPANSLGQLVNVPALRGRVVVSEVHRCASYARYLAAANTKDIVIGLNSPAPSDSGNVASQTMPRWMRSNQSGVFKANVDAAGQRRFYPLYKLVSVQEGTAGRRGSVDEVVEGQVLPLPDARPPWMTDRV